MVNELKFHVLALVATWNSQMWIETLTTDGADEGPASFEERVIACFPRKPTKRQIATAQDDLGTSLALQRSPYRILAVQVVSDRDFQNWKARTPGAFYRSLTSLSENPSVNEIQLHHEARSVFPHWKGIPETRLTNSLKRFGLAANLTRKRLGPLYVLISTQN